MLQEEVERLGREVPMQLLCRRELLPLLGPSLSADRTFRMTGSGQLPVGAEFDSGETTILRHPPSKMTPHARAYLLAITITARALRANAAATLDLPELVVSYLAEGFKIYRQPIGRGLYLVERATVETNLAIWHEFAPATFAQVPDHTRDLALIHRAIPHDLRTMVLMHRTLASERAKLYEMPTEKDMLTRSDGRLLTEFEVWEKLFPPGAEIFPLEHSPPSPP